MFFKTNNLCIIWICNWPQTLINREWKRPKNNACDLKNILYIVTRLWRELKALSAGKTYTCRHTHTHTLPPFPVFPLTLRPVGLPTFSLKLHWIFAACTDIGEEHDNKKKDKQTKNEAQCKTKLDLKTVIN